MKETAKIIGAYELDNKQKAAKIDITTKTPEELNFLLKMLKPSKQEPKTIDITPIEPE